MKYLHIKWIHSFPDEPVDIYSEIDDEGYETRKVEIFPDGSIGFATPFEQMLSTHLGEKPVPPLDEIACDAQFQPTPISKEDFERTWSRRPAAFRA
jgi:hypothetical protein